MGIKDAPYSRSPNTAMRDLLRQIDRSANTSKVARPTAPPPGGGALLAFAAAPPPEPSTVAVGDWLLTQDPATGDLLAVHSDGTTRTIATKGDT